MDLKTLINFAITVGGWCVMIGVYTAKIKQHEQEIQDLRERQNSTEELLKNIDKQLTEVNTKMSLLLQGRINFEGAS